MENKFTHESLGEFFRQHLEHMELLVFYGKCIVEDLVVIGPDGREIGSVRLRDLPEARPLAAEVIPEDPEMTRDEAAHYMGCDVRQIDRWAKKGKLTKCRDTDNKPYFRKSELAVFYKYKTGFDHP